LKLQGYEVFGFADDIVIMVRGKVDSVLSERMHAGLNYAFNWCEEANRRIKPNKILVISFTRKHKHNLNNPVMRGVTIEFSRDTKYLRVVIYK
jgi:hypothetical protein